MHTLALKRLVKKHGGTVVNESSGRMCVYQCEAPAGKVWSCCGIHCIRVEWRKGEDAYRISAIADGMERVAMGTEDCEDEDCDYCHPI